MSAGRRSGDLVHPMVYCPELHFGEFASAVADMKNSSAVSILAGLFFWGGGCVRNPAFLQSMDFFRQKIRLSHRPYEIQLLKYWLHRRQGGMCQNLTAKKKPKVSFTWSIKNLRELYSKDLIDILHRKQ